MGEKNVGSGSFRSWGYGGGRTRSYARLCFYPSCSSCMEDRFVKKSCKTRTFMSSENESSTSRCFDFAGVRFGQEKLVLVTRLIELKLNVSKGNCSALCTTTSLAPTHGPFTNTKHPRNHTTDKRRTQNHSTQSDTYMDAETETHTKHTFISCARKHKVAQA